MLLQEARIHGQEHDSAPRDSRELVETTCYVSPVMDREHGERGVDAVVGKRKRLGDAPDSGTRRGWSLSDHRRGRLDRDHGAIRRLVRAGSGAYVDNRRCGTDGLS